MNAAMNITETNKEIKPNSEYVSVPIDIEYGTTEPKGSTKINCPSSFLDINAITYELNHPYTFVVNICDTYCTYEYTFDHNEEVAIHDIAKEIAKMLKCEVPKGKFISQLKKE